MVDWTASMQQSFEYYLVDPILWRDTKKLSCVKSCTITRDSDTDTLGSATFDVTEILGECYIRVYLVTIQNGVTERHPLGTFLAQTPNSSFDGKVRSTSVDAYTPLIELKENTPPIGYYQPKYNEYDHKQTILDDVYYLVKNNVRAPVLRSSPLMKPSNILYEDHVAESGENWLKFTKSLLDKANYEFSLDDISRISFAPVRDIDSLIPVWTYDDGNSSILYPDLSLNHDIFGIPNIVEVTWSTPGRVVVCTKENKDPDSPVSIPSRGRKIIYRETNPSGISENPDPSSTEVDVYAEQLLKNLSTLQCKVSYSHGYCPVRLSDCVRLNYQKAGLTNVNAKVISQSIKCTPGCQVQEKAIFNVKLWR